MRSAANKWISAMLLAGSMAWAQAKPFASPEPAKPVPESKARAGGSYLGIEPRDLTPDRVAQLKLRENHGVEVSVLDQDGPTAKAGIKEHDVILTFNGQTVENADRLRHLLRGTPPGVTVTLGISRDGQARNITATLANRRQIMAASSPDQVVRIPEIYIPSVEFELPEFAVVQYWAQSGVMVEDLTPQLAEFFGVHSGQGVLVRSVEKGSPAEAAGLKAGDVIVKVNGESVPCAADWRHSMRGLRGGTINLGIVRDRHEQTLSMKIPERSTSSVFSIDLSNLRADLEHMREELNRMDLQHSLEIAQTRMHRDLEQAMREMQRELEKAQRELEWVP